MTSESNTVAGLRAGEAIDAALSWLAKELMQARQDNLDIIGHIMTVLTIATRRWIAMAAGPEPSQATIAFATYLASEFGRRLAGTDWGKAITTHCAPE